MPKRRMVVLTEGQLNLFSAKTAVSVIRYCPDEVVCVLDSQTAGQDLFKIVGTGSGVPIVATLKEALAYKPNTLLIGIAPAGGKLPASFKKLLLTAIKAGLNIVSGLHEMLADDPAFAAAAKKAKRKITDVRRMPEHIGVSTNTARFVKAKRCHTVGSDANLGKMTVSLELTAEAKRRGWDAEFAATGQTGIMIAGSGYPLDHTISDYTNGVAEALILERKNREILFVEGQGSINHAAYSAVTLGLLHGCAPDSLILCHCPSRKETRSVPGKIPSLNHLRKLYEDIASLITPCKVIGIGLNTFDIKDEKKALGEKKRAEDETGLPATDVLRWGVDPLMDAVEKYYGKR